MVQKDQTRERKATPSGVFDWTQSGQSGAWGNPNQRFRNIQKDIPKTLLAYVSGMFSSLILHYGLEYSYTLTFDMTTDNLNGFTVECEYNVDWSG